MNPTDLRLLAVLLQKPYTALALAKLLKREYTYIIQRLMLLQDNGLVLSDRMINYRTRKKLYMVPNRKKKEVFEIIDRATTSEGRLINL